MQSSRNQEASEFYDGQTLSALKEKVASNPFKNIMAKNQMYK